MLSYLIICIHESFGFVRTQSWQIQAFEKGAVFMRTKTQYKRSNKGPFSFILPHEFSGQYPLLKAIESRFRFAHRFYLTLSSMN